MFTRLTLVATSKYQLGETNNAFYSSSTQVLDEFNHHYEASAHFPETIGNDKSQQH